MSKKVGSPEACCEAPRLHWESRRIVDRFADVLTCANCHRTHKIEDWAICVPPPSGERCLNCGGEMTVDTSRSRHGLPEKSARCGQCGLTDGEARKLHGKLAKLHPSGDYLPAAKAALEGGRTVLAFKLATAHLAYVGDERAARELRLQGLDALGLAEEALAEAWAWYEDGGPTDVLGLIAGLEAARGNMEGTVAALERGLQLDPQNTSMWTDYAELQAHLDDRDGALTSASYGLGDARFKKRCLEVIAAIAERYYAEDRLQEALAAVNRAGAGKQESAAVTWLTARVAARLKQWDEAQAWLTVTLKLDPEHRLAREAMERIKPRDKKRGWFGWMGGSGS